MIPASLIQTGTLSLLSRADLLVFTAVQAHADHGWTTPLTTQVLSSITGLTDRSIFRATQRLESSKLIQVKPGPGRTHANTYCLAPQSTTPAPEPAVPAADPQSASSAQIGNRKSEIGNPAPNPDTSVKVSESPSPTPLSGFTDTAPTSPASAASPSAPSTPQIGNWQSAIGNPSQIGDRQSEIGNDLLPTQWIRQMISYRRHQVVAILDDPNTTLSQRSAARRLLSADSDDRHAASDFKLLVDCTQGKCSVIPAASAPIGNRQSAIGNPPHSVIENRHFPTLSHDEHIHNLIQACLPKNAPPPDPNLHEQIARQLLRPLPTVPPQTPPPPQPQ